MTDPTLARVARGKKRDMAEMHTTDGVRLRYEVAGPADGAPVALIMGLGMGGAMWGLTTERLAEEDFRVVTFDNRGAGASETPLAPWTTQTMARDVVEVLDAAGVEGRAHVHGVSLGGMIAQEVALQHPDRVESLVLQSTTGGAPRFDFFPVRGVLGIVGSFLQRPPADTDEALRRLTDVGAGPGFELTPAQAESLIAAFEDQAGPHGMVQQVAAVLRHRTWPRLGAIEAPTLVLHGTADKLIDVRAGRALAEAIPGADYREYEDAGHLLDLEVPEALDAVTGFFYSPKLLPM